MKTTLAVVFLAFGSSAWAQGVEFWFSGGQSLMQSGGLGTDAAIGGNPNDVELTDGFRFALRGAFNTRPHSGFEVMYGYSRTQLKFNDAGGMEQGMAYHTVMLNYMLYLTPEGTRFRPFGTGGVGFINYVPPGSSATSGGGSTKLGFNYGAGIKAKVTGMWALRFDLRQYATPKPFDLPLKSGWIRPTEISAGIGVEF
jgi:opacity protein-like surface antigen